MGFTNYTTPNKGSRAAQKIINHPDDVQENSDDMEIMPLLENVLDDTESLLSETSFNGVFTERERSRLNLELQTLRGNLKLLKNKIIFYDSKIRKSEAKVKQK